MHLTHASAWQEGQAIGRRRTAVYLSIHTGQGSFSSIGASACSSASLGASDDSAAAFDDSAAAFGFLSAAFGLPRFLGAAVASGVAFRNSFVGSDSGSAVGLDLRGGIFSKMSNCRV